MSATNSVIMGRLVKAEAWAPDVVAEALGVELSKTRLWLADGPPVRPRLSLDGRKRGEPTMRYIWGPDLRFLLS